jgi:uncharacterized membrane protein YphA (DoxX/SURF4 family)
MTESAALRRIGITLLWLVTIWETLTMGVAGFAKFGSAEVWVRWFGTWGYPAWLVTVVGTIELLGALLLLIPRSAPYAAGSLIVIMFGALFTVLTNESGDFTAVPVLMHLVGLSIIAWFRRPVWLGRHPAARRITPT